MTARFTDSTVIITGAGSGLGQATAERLAAEGANLVLVDMNAEGLEATKKLVTTDAPEARVELITADVTRPEDVEKTRTPYGTQRQIGSALYTLSSYLTHSCDPSARVSFASGTTELHLVANEKPLFAGAILQSVYRTPLPQVEQQRVSALAKRCGCSLTARCRTCLTTTLSKPAAARALSLR